MKLRVVHLCAMAFAVSLAAAWPGATAARAQGAANADEPSAEEKREIQRLTRRLVGREENARASAAGQLGRMGPKARSAVALLASRVQSDPNVGVRSAAAEALGHIGVASGNVLGALGGALEHADPTVRASAAFGLGLLGEQAAKTWTSLVKLLADPEAPVRRQAATALGLIGTQPAKVGPRLEVALADPDRMVRTEAAGALARLGLGGERCVAPLLEVVEDQSADGPARQRAAEGLCALGPVARSAVPALAKVLSEKKQVNRTLPYWETEIAQHDALRAAVARALGTLGPAAAEAVPALEALSGDGNAACASAAREALARIQATPGS